MSMQGGVQPGLVRRKADQTIISGNHREGSASFDIRLEMEMVSFETEVRQRLACLMIARSCARLMPHLVLSLCCFIVPGRAWPRGMVGERRQVELEADADSAPSPAGGDGIDGAPARRSAFDVDAPARFGSPSRALRRLFEREHERLRIGAASSAIHLVDAEAVAAAPSWFITWRDRQPDVDLLANRIRLGIVLAEGVAEVA